MKKLPPKLKFLLLILANTLPFALDVLFFFTGKMDNLFLFIPVFSSLTVLNYLNLRKSPYFVLMQMYILLLVIGSGCASTHLYYHNISNDAMTPVAGQVFVLFESVAVIIATSILAIVKAIINKKRLVKNKG